MHPTRYLVVTADDFGIGPATTRGILDLATQGLVTSTVLLVNSPYAEEALLAWQRAGRVPELGWHPCLTIDRPVLPASVVPTLVGPDGRFHPLGKFMRLLFLGKIRTAEVAAEWQAQYRRFVALVGHPPAVVNTHHHIQVFPQIGRVLLDLLGDCRAAPYIRRVLEPWRTLLHVPGARCKRLFLSVLGRRAARRQALRGFPGNDFLAGVTDCPCVARPEFLVRWLTRMPGYVVELTCHPGHHDETLLGRDAAPEDGHLARRVNEFRLLQQPSFLEACRRAGFTRIATGQLPGALRAMREAA